MNKENDYPIYHTNYEIWDSRVKVRTQCLSTCVITEDGSVILSLEPCKQTETWPQAPPHRQAWLFSVLGIFIFYVW